MRTIICNFNLFDIVQSIYIYNQDLDKMILMSKCSLDTLGETISELCHARGIDKVHLFGAEDYASILINEIEKHTELMYSNQKLKIDIEVN